MIRAFAFHLPPFHSISENDEVRIDRTASPDNGAAGFLQDPPDPFRYDRHILDPDEVSGIATGMIPAGTRVLEVGCGTGSLGRIVADTCHAEVVGVEPDSARAERAKARGLEVYRAYLSRELICQIGNFDIVLLADVLEHLPDPQAMLLLCREALKPRGAVIISVPNVAHWSVRLNLFRGRFKYESVGIMDATHLRWFTAASITSLVISSGFRVTKYRATANPELPGNCQPPLVWLPVSYKTEFLRLASRHWPTLFGAQHVLKAEMV